MTPPVLELRGIVKRFGSVQALRGADFVLGAGEVHALLGENGAGKSTLMHIAFGMVRADGGEIACDGKSAQIRSPRDARDRGIGMVHQHFTSVPALTVAENVALSLGPRRWKRRTGSGALQTVLLRRLEQDLDPSAVVDTLTVGQKQRLEIVKALATGARVLLLDEPTAGLAPAETEELMNGIREFAVQGGSVVLITHKLPEVFEVADRVTVLRRGVVTLTGPIAGLTQQSLAEAMIGGAAPGTESVSGLDARSQPGPVLVRMDGLVIPPLGGRGPGIREATLSVRAGEIVGVAAIEGNGQRELFHGIAGLLAPVSGRLEVAGPVALVPEDRTTEGLIPALTLGENVVLGFDSAAPWVRRKVWLDWGSARRFTGQLLSTYDVLAPGPEVPAATLSGGNQQKLVLARALASQPSVLIAENPTRGLDIRATLAVQQRLREAAQAGVAVLVHSSDLDELLAGSDRIVVVAGGRVREMPAGTSRQAIGAAMLGLAEEPRGA